MATRKPKYKRGSGPDRLPQGAASDLNAGIQEITPKEGRQATVATNAQLDYEYQLTHWQPGDGPVPQPPAIQTGKAGIQTTYNGETYGNAGQPWGQDQSRDPQGVQFQDPTVDANAPANMSDAEAAIAGPKIGASIGDVGTPMLGRTSAPPPSDVYDWLPTLTEAANATDAPPQLQALARLIQYHLQAAQ